MESEPKKLAAAERAVDFVEPGMTVGLGTGTTSALFIRALGKRSLAIRGVATSAAAAKAANLAGIRLVELDDIVEVDLTIDGADQVTPLLDAIKGKGGAFTTERMVWEASKAVIIIADSDKLSPQLGGLPLPLEVLKFGEKATIARLSRRLADAGFEGEIEASTGDYSPPNTIGGNPIYLAKYGVIERPGDMKLILDTTHGVVDHGLFAGKATRAIIAHDGGIDILNTGSA